MNTYLKLAICYLKKQKIRSMILIIGIALAVMLVFGFNVINESQSKNQISTIYDLYGSYHATFSNLDKDEIKKLENDKAITKIETAASLGNVSYKNGTQMKLESSNKEYIKAHNYKLKEGKLPSNTNEIVLEEKSLEEMGLNKELNQTINMKIKKEYKDENGINQVFIEKHSFKLVGIFEKPELYYKDWYELKAFTYFKEGTTNIIPDKLITYKSVISLKTGVRNIDTNLNEIRSKNNIGRLDYEPNIHLTTALDDYNASHNNDAKKEIKLLVIIMAILLIYNLFNISLTEMINQIGTLRTIGASKIHVRKILALQSIFILVIGVILGLLAGVIFAYLGMKFFSFTGTNIDTSTAKVYISSKNILDAIKVGAITVLISSMIPIYMAGRISPIDALRKTDNSNKKQKEKLHHKVIKNVFGISGEMAYKNVWRNKLRAWISILAISIGGILFIQTISVLKSDSNDKINGAIAAMGDSSFKLSYRANVDANLVGYTKDDVQEISNINGVKRVSTKYETDGYLEAKTNELYEKYKKYNGISNANKKIEIPIIVKSYDDNQLDSYQEFSKEGKLSSVNNQNDDYPNVVLFNNYYDILENHRSEGVIKNIEVGDLITVKVPTIKNDASENEYCTVRVSAILDERWIFEGDSARGRYPEIIMSQNDIERIKGKNAYSQIFIETEGGQDSYIDKELNKILKEKHWALKTSKLQFQNEDKYYKQKGAQSQLIIIILILLIASLNVFCSIRTSLLIRTKEFSTLRAIGMSTKQVKIMVLKESIIYGVLSSLIAAAIGSYKYYTLLKHMNKDYAYAYNMSTIEEFKFPVTEILIFTLLAIGICIFSAYLSNKKIEKLNIIEGLTTAE